MPDGSPARFRVVESPDMAPELAARFTEIKTYAGRGIDDPTASIRFDLAPRGLSAIVLGARAARLVAPHPGGTRSTTGNGINGTADTNRRDRGKCRVPSPGSSYPACRERRGRVLRRRRCLPDARGQVQVGWVDAGGGSAFTGVASSTAIVERNTTAKSVFLIGSPSLATGDATSPRPSQRRALAKAYRHDALGPRITRLASGGGERHLTDIVESKALPAIGLAAEIAAGPR